jgi:hypothetical protein
VNIVDQEEVDSLEETTMLLWDPELLMPFNDIFEVQEPPVEVLAVKTRSGGQPVSNEFTISQTSRGKQTRDHLQTPFVSQRNIITSIHENHQS